MDLGKLSDKFLGGSPDLEANGFVEAEMESDFSEPLDGSLTNELVVTQVGTVLKSFSEKPKMSYVQMLGRVPALKVKRQNQQDRIENEKKFRNFLDYDIDVPDILGVSGEYVEFERLDGEDLNDYVNENPEEAWELGTEVGEFLNYVHKRDGAITDFRVNNFRVQESGELAFLDAEYFLEDANRWEKEMDIITLISSLKQIEPEPYEEFRDGFEKSYGEETGPFSDVASSVTSQVHARYLEEDSRREENARENTFFRYL